MFTRIFSLFMAVILLVTGVMTLLCWTTIRDHQINARLDQLKQEARDFYALREQGFEQIKLDVRELERVVLLNAVDRRWMDHIDAMDHLREGIGLRAFANRNPITEYKIEGYDMFDEMVRLIREDTVRSMFLARINVPQERKQVAKAEETNLDQAKAAGGPAGPKKVAKKAGRNDPCPCGSGKKFKNCCGA